MKQKIDKLMNELIKENITETTAVKDKCNIIVTHKVHNAISGLVRQLTPKFIIDWDKQIIHSEILASYYESLLDTVKQNDIKDISINNQQLLDIAYGKTTYKLKTYLYDSNRRSRRINDVRVLPLELTQRTDKEITLQSILDERSQVNPIEDLFKEQGNEFIKWFLLHRKELLTKKQLDFLEGNFIYHDETLAWKMKKRIAERISNQYNKSKKKNTKKDILEQIVNAKDIIRTYTKYKSRNFIIDIVNDKLTYKELIILNKQKEKPLWLALKLKRIFNNVLQTIE